MQNKKFSIEDLFHITEIENHAIEIQFSPTSKSHRQYHYGVTVVHVLNVKRKDVLNNIRNEQFTYGRIEATGYDNTPPPTIDEIRLKFDTNEIESIERI